MRHRTYRVALFAATLALLPPAAFASPADHLRKPLLLAVPAGLPEIPECSGILTQAMLDRVSVAPKDPAEAFEAWRRQKITMVEAPPSVECQSKLWQALHGRSGLFNVVPQSTTPLGLVSPDPAGQAFFHSLAASVGTNVDPAGGIADYQGEMQIAVNPNNPLQLIGGANTFYRDPSANCLSPTGGFSGTFGTQALYGTTDGGSNWTYRCAPWPATLTGGGANLGFGSDPAMAWDNQGRAYAAYMLLSDGSALTTAIVVARSSDAGQTWTSLGTVVDNLTNASLFDDKEMMAVDNSAGPPSAKSHPGRLYVVWDQNNIERAAHSDDGVTWTTVVLPSTGFGDYDIGSDVKVGPDGTVYVIWNRLIYPSGQTGERIVFSKSVDGGNTWTTPAVVVSTALLSFGTNNNPPAQNRRGVNAFGSLDVDRNPASPFYGNLYVAYSDFPAGTTFGTDINAYVVTSTNGGTTWSSPVKVNDDAGVATQFFPWLSVDQSDGTVNVSWYDTRLDTANNRKTQVFYARSSNGGASFEPNLLVTDSGAVGWRNAVNYSDDASPDNGSSNANQYGDYSGIVAANRQVHPFWVDTRQFFPSSDTNVPSRLEDAATATIVNCTAPASIAPPAGTPACGASRVQLSWSVPAAWGTNASGGTYSVYRSTSAVFPGGTPLASNLSATSYDDASGLPGVTYYYFVAARNNCPGTTLTPMTTVTVSDAIVFPPCGATLGVLSGSVTTNGIPIAGATVTAGVYSMATDASGNYAFSPIVTGTYTVSVAMAGYDPASQSNVTVTTGATTTANFNLTPTPTAACFTDTTQADFQAGNFANIDLTSTPGSAKLSTSAPGVYQTSGALFSSVKDSGAVVPGGAMTWTTLTWTATTPASTLLRFQIAASNAAAGPFTFVGPDGTGATFFTTSGASLAQFNGRRYLKYAAYLSTSDTSATPSLDSVTICDQVGTCAGTTAPPVTPAQTTVCPFSTGNTATGPAGALAYAWSITNGTITGGGSAQTVTYTAGVSGNVGLTLTTTVATGCAAATAVNVPVVTATPTPAITPGGSTSLCPGESVTLTSSSASGYQWYKNGAAIAGATSVSYVATTSGSYIVAVTENGCSSIPSAPVTVTQLTRNPGPAVAAGGPTTFCAGGSVKLTSSAGQNNQWYRNGSLIPGATAQEYIVTSSGDYAVTTSPVGGCTSFLSTAITVTVNAIPAIPTISTSGPTSFCSGGSVTLTSSNSSGNQWYQNGTLLTGATNMTYAATTSGDYTVITTANGCASSPSAATTVLVINIPAAPSISAGGPTTFCQGGTVTLTSSAASGNQWYLNGNAISGATNTTYAAAATGDYTVMTTQGSCSSAPSAATHVTVNAIPATPTISASGPVTLCTGGSVKLTSSSATGNQWFQDGNLLSAETGTFINAVTGGIYTVQVTANGCTGSMSSGVTVTVSVMPPQPTITPNGLTSFCNGGSVTLTSSSAVNNQWYKDGAPIAGAAGASYIATTTGTYTVIVTNNGCSSPVSDNIPVTVYAIPPKPVIAPAGSVTLCSADPGVQLSSSNQSGNQWYKDGAPISGATSQVFIATVAGNYSVVTVLNGCPSPASATTTVVTATSPVSPTITPNGPTSFCPGGSVTFTSSSATGNQWLRNGTPIAGATGQSYVAATSGLYAVQLTSGACTSTSLGANVTLISAPPTPTISVSGPLATCDGYLSNTTLTSSSNSGNQWFENGVAIPGATAKTYQIHYGGSYTVQATASGCPSAVSAPVVASVYLTSAKPIFTTGNGTTGCPNLTLYAPEPAGTVTQWYMNGSPIPGATGLTYVATVSANYALQIFDGPCPSPVGDPVAITILAPLPKPAVTADGPTTICGTGSVTLHSTPATYINWYRNGQAINAYGQTITVSESGSYQSIVSNPIVCWSTLSDPINIVIDAIPNATITPSASKLQTGANGTATVAAVAGATYHWVATNGTIIGSAAGTSVSYTAGTPGTLTLKATVTTGGGCADTKTANLLVTPLPGQEKFDPNGDVTIDPADVFYLVSYLFTSGPAPAGTAGPVASGDANGDGVVDPADVFYTVNYLFTSGPHPLTQIVGTSTAGQPPLRGTVSLGRATLRDGKYIVPIVVSTMSGSAQALALKVRIDGNVESATIHRAGNAESWTPAFETTSDTAHASSYIVAFDASRRLDGVVAELEISAEGGGPVRLSLDPAVTMLTNQSGTRKAGAANGALTLRGSTISIDRPDRTKDPQ